MVFKSLSLFTDRLEAQYLFYTQILGFTCLNKNENSFTLNIGSSHLIFTDKEECKPYHFAFNIPYASVEKALEWLKHKVSILKDGNNEIQEFENWSARAIYFYDEDKNIVEFIGRKALDYTSNQLFSISEVKEISEIGLASADIEAVYNSIVSSLPLMVYDGTFERFCAIGNETGLFICVNPEYKKWFPTNDRIFHSAFSAVISHSGIDYTVSYEKGKVEVELH